VPTVRELQSLRVCSTGFESETRDLQDGGDAVNRSCHDGSNKPTIDSARFPQTSAIAFWSSSPDVVNSGAWYVSFGSGRVGYDYREASFAVRLDRASQ
jgi:hypothetical protein